MVIAFIIAIVAVYIVRKDYTNYSNSQVVTAKVMDIEILNSRCVNVTYQYDFSGKKYAVGKMQEPQKLKIGDKLKIRINKNKPETILYYCNINMVVFRDITIVLLFIFVIYAFHVLIYALLNNTVSFITEEKKSRPKIKKKVY